MQVGDMVKCRTVDGKPVGLIVSIKSRATSPSFIHYSVLLGGREVVFLKENLEVISENR
jgi:hypothetical protein